MNVSQLIAVLDAYRKQWGDDRQVILFSLTDGEQYDIHEVTAPDDTIPISTIGITF